MSSFRYYLFQETYMERVFAVVKRIFYRTHVLVTTERRVSVKMFFACFCFNLVQLGSLGG